MKRNWDMIREILTKVEACTLPTEMVQLSDFPDEKAAEASYHVELLIDAGLIDGQMAKTMGAEINAFFAHRLTWDGHEFLDAIRSDTVWNRTKKIFADKGISMTIDLVKEAAVSIAAALLKAG